MSKDLASAAREVGESLGSTVRATKIARVVSAKPSKQEQLAKLIIELGLDAAQHVFERVRARLERIQ